jgi:hypothetical protein
MMMMMTVIQNDNTASHYFRTTVKNGWNIGLYH